jgi:hypothetical protein
MLQDILFFAPIILSAVCLPTLYRRAGFPAKIYRLMWMPALLTVSSFAAVVAGERTLSGGPIGLWSIAAALLVLVAVDWPRQRRQE